MKVDHELKSLGAKLAAVYDAEGFAFDHDAKSGLWTFRIFNREVEIQCFSRVHLMDQIKDAIHAHD